MPTDILFSVAERSAREKKDAADLRAALVLVPVIACLFSIALSIESRAFECALIESAAE